jgi:AraC-like DNA-binding protein
MTVIRAPGMTGNTCSASTKRRTPVGSPVLLRYCVPCWKLSCCGLSAAPRHPKPEASPSPPTQRPSTAHYASSREVNWYARQLGFSPRTLSRATHQAVGRSAKQFIDDRVVLEAKRLLAHTEITVAECARKTGFDDPANFSKFFRDRALIAPGEFAARAREKVMTSAGQDDLRRTT